MNKNALLNLQILKKLSLALDYENEILRFFQYISSLTKNSQKPYKIKLI